MAPFPKVEGLHHVTAIAGDPSENLRFYTNVLGQRLVKKTVNFDDPTTYHFYFGDADGTPGTVMTHFPWPDASPNTVGTGETRAVAYRAPTGTLDAWNERLAGHGVTCTRQNRFGTPVLSFPDPDGLRLEIVPADEHAAVRRWDGSPVPGDMQLEGFFGVTLQVADPRETIDVLQAMGFVETNRAVEPAGERIRLVGVGELGGVVDLLATGHALPSRFGRGSVHHIAFRLPDDEAQARARDALKERGLNVTGVKDRMYFRSIYAREPGGVLFEFATEPPGFATDEPPERLGETLTLPDWLEPRRAELEQALPEVRT